TLGGLALGIGMMVDSSIVILENIYSYRQRGYSLFDSATKGAAELTPAVIASTTTTLVVFFTDCICRRNCIGYLHTTCINGIIFINCFFNCGNYVSANVVFKTIIESDGRRASLLV